MIPPRLLVVDDDAESCTVVAEALQTEGYEVATAEGGRAALALARERVFDIVVSDIRMPDLDGLALLRGLREANPDVSVILMTAFGTVEAALEAIRDGAYDYVSKPLHLDELLLSVRRAVEQRRLVRENQRFRQALQDRYHLENIVGVSPRMLDVFKLIARVAPTRSTVLITGESGTGKEIVAHTVHSNSPRAAGPFVTIDCAGLAETLLESELFGHVRGAFTGAVAARRGLFETGNSGTVFLDELGDIGPNTQAKLLRVLELQEIKPVGGNESVRIDVRLIAATNKDLQTEVREGRFREDLFYRLNVERIHLPPLRERREDIPVLAHHFLRKFGEANGRAIGGIASETMARLEAYSWPGNVRELENAIERAVAVSTHPILLPDDLPLHLAGPVAATEAGKPGPLDLISLEDLTRQHLARVLAATGWNKKRAAEILGVDRRTLYRMLERYAISAPNSSSES
ncbi:MAG: sigma-54-dependent Fis family transcriptional regulator [candidate division NC10 bacterium]|nr:sigma-54-dependent Fis family transcriptional regulator [candidate division NC10 bacterium]